MAGRWRIWLAGLSGLMVWPAAWPGGTTDLPPVTAGTALVVAIDISSSVDEHRYRLQIDGIAQALEDKAVVDAILAGPGSGILFTLVEWADSAAVTLPWQHIASREDALRVAARIRALPHRAGEYTCVARMMRMVNERVVPSLPLPALRVVVDVSGDGIDNCSGSADTADARDGLVAARVTINGLPIIVPGENDIVGAGAYRAPGFGLFDTPRGPEPDSTELDVWYRAHVIGGHGSFLLTANGYDDFGRAFRQKFVSEISFDPCAPHARPGRLVHNVSSGCR